LAGGAASNDGLPVGYVPPSGRKFKTLAHRLVG